MFFRDILFIYSSRLPARQTKTILIFKFDVDRWHPVRGYSFNNAEIFCNRDIFTFSVEFDVLFGCVLKMNATLSVLMRFLLKFYNLTNKHLSFEFSEKVLQAN